MTVLHAEKLAVMAVAALMVICGLLQMVQPAMLLQMGLPAASPAEQQLMATLGLLLLVLGAILLQATRRGEAQRLVLLWVALEKAGFVALLLYGVYGGIYAASAGPMAVFDSMVVLLLLDYRRRLPPERCSPSTTTPNGPRATNEESCA